MRIPIMTYNIQHGIDYVKVLERRNGAKAPDLQNISPEQKEIFEKYKNKKPRTEDPSLIRLDKMAAVIRAEGAKIVALNEVRDESEDPCFFPQAKQMSDMTGLPYYYFGQAIDMGGRGPYGNALISAYPFLSVETVMIPDPLVKDEPTYYETRCLIKAVLDISEDAEEGDPKTLTVFVTHMGLAKQEARNAVQTVMENLPSDGPAVLMGDFNVTPDSDILAPLRTVFKDAGDLLPEGTYSWPSEDPERKIDYVMATGPVHFEQAAIPAAVVSDHRPHTAVLVSDC